MTQHTEFRTTAQIDRDRRSQMEKAQADREADPDHHSNWVYPRSSKNDPVRECLAANRSPVGLHDDSIAKDLDQRIWELHEFLEKQKAFRDEILEKTEFGNPVLFDDPLDHNQRDPTRNHARLLVFHHIARLEEGLENLLELSRMRMLFLERGNPEAVYHERKKRI